MWEEKGSEKNYPSMTRNSELCFFPKCVGHCQQGVQPSGAFLKRINPEPRIYLDINFVLQCMFIVSK